MKKVLLGVLLSFTFFTSVNSATINVPADQPTIQAGIDASVNGDTVLVAPGNYVESFEVISKSVHIISESGYGSTYLSWDPSGTAGILFQDSDSSSLIGFSFKDITSLQVIGVDLVRSSVQISHNWFSNISGASILIFGRELSIKPSEISFNIFTQLTLTNPGVIIFSNSTGGWVHDNTIDNVDIGIVAYSDNCIIENNILINCNKALLDGFFNIQEQFNIFWGNNINYYHHPTTGPAVPLDSTSFISDPLFIDIVSFNYGLQYISPAIDAGNPDSLYNDPDGTRNDIGALYYQAPFSILNTFVENDTLNLHVLNHTPEISWNFSTLTTQTEIEIAIGTDNDWTFAEMWNPAPITSADTFITYNGSALLDGETYYGRLKVSNGTAWSDWFEFSFRMNSLPTVPVPLSPIDFVETNSMPTLWIQNSVDAEGDSLRYDFSGNKIINSDVFFEPLLAESNVLETTDSTGLVVSAPLDENVFYVWEVRAYDGYEYSAWTILLESSFLVNEINETPSAPFTFTPNETTSPLNNLQPTFVWTISIDPDPIDTIYYRLHVALDSNFNFETLFDSIPQPMFAIPQVYFTIPFPLENNEDYWWKVDAIDQGTLTATSNVQHFWTSCCIGIRGNVDGDINEEIDISDLVFLVAFMFQGGSEPICIDEANINGIGEIDISDLVAIVSFMFQGGVPPADCP